jgi:predicted HicB family RNase H-like nuclease
MFILGRITLPMPPELHAELFRKAQNSGDSLDTWLIKEIKGNADLIAV